MQRAARFPLKRFGRILGGFALYGPHPSNLHVARGDGARFVQAQHIHARQSCDAVELLDEHLAFRQTHDGHSQNR